VCAYTNQHFHVRHHCLGPFGRAWTFWVIDTNQISPRISLALDWAIDWGSLRGLNNGSSLLNRKCFLCVNAMLFSAPEARVQRSVSRYISRTCRLPAADFVVSFTFRSFSQHACARTGLHGLHVQKSCAVLCRHEGASLGFQFM